MHAWSSPPGTSRTVPSTSGRTARLITFVVALLVTLTVVAPVGAGAGPTRLSDPAVSPRSGTTQTTISVAVQYRNREGSPADWVRVRIGGTTYAMRHTGGTDWKNGTTFSWSGRLPAGSHSVAISAMSRDRFEDSLSAGTVTITAPPTPTPKATPKPTPRPTATPAPTPRATPTPAPRPTPTPAPRATPKATPGPTSTAVATPSGGPTDAPVASPSAGPSSVASPSPVPSDDSVAVVPDGKPGGPGDPTTAGPGPGGPVGDPGAGAWLALVAGSLDPLGTGRPALPLGLVTTLVTTTGIVGAAMAFGLFGKRRRDGEPPDTDEVLARHAASPLTVASATSLAERPGSGAPTAAQVAAAPSPLDGEMAMPRWRRPSLLEARKADPVRDAAPAAPRLTFDHGLVGPLDGRERRLIRYTLVRLLDQPDELRGAEIAFLDQGDEVQLLEKRGAYWLVLCPDGRQGWIHKMTLGDVVADGQPSSPTATMPIAADTWTMGDDVDGDVLTAYLESRRRT